MYDSLFPEETKQVINDRIRRPLPDPAPQTGAFSNFWTAVKDVIPAAGLEAARSANTILAQAAKAQAPADEAMLQYIDPKSVEHGKSNPDIDLDAQLRAGIKRFTPDPEATGWAGQIVHGVGKVMGKAVGYGSVGGMPGAIFGTGADEGINETLRLTDQGVDLGTAAKVGALHGASTALSVALPVAGKTVAQTAGFVAVSGPGAFMAENAAARAILENADYSAISKQYDPFDPVGLTIATLLPAAIGAGAHAIRAKNAPKSTPDQVAAAQTVLAAEHVDSTSLSKPDDVTGMNAHIDALEAVVKQMEGDGPIGIPEGVHVDTDSQLFKEFSKSMDEAITAHSKEIEERAIEQARIEQEFDAGLQKAIEEKAAAPKEASDNPADVITKAVDELTGVKQEPAKADAGPSKLDAEFPEIAAAKQILDSGRDIPVKYTDEFGTEHQVTARDLMLQAEDAMKLAETDSKAFDAAITCFLGG